MYGTAFCSAMPSLLLRFDAGIFTNLHWVCLLVKGRTLLVVLLKESLRKLPVSLNLKITRLVVRNRPDSASKYILSSMLWTTLWSEVQTIAIQNALPPAALASPLCQTLG